MRNGVLAAVLTMLAMVPAGVAAQGPARVYRPVTPNHSGHWFVPPRPHGWVWGGPGWWGGAYRPPMRGYIVPSFWLTPAYVVSDWDVYGFAQPGPGRRWVRYYDDALLVDGRGMIYDSVQGVPWGRYTRGPVPQYVGDEPDALPPYGGDYDDEVTWNGGSSSSGHQIWAWPGQAQATPSGTVIMVPPNSVTTITFQPQEPTPVAYVGEARPVWKAAPRTKVKVRPLSKPRVIGRAPVKKD